MSQPKVKNDGEVKADKHDPANDVTSTLSTKEIITSLVVNDANVTIVESDDTTKVSITSNDGQDIDVKVDGQKLVIQRSNSTNTSTNNFSFGDIDVKIGGTGFGFNQGSFSTTNGGAGFSNVQNPQNSMSKTPWMITRNNFADTFFIQDGKGTHWSKLNTGIGFHNLVFTVTNDSVIISDVVHEFPKSQDPFDTIEGVGNMVTKMNRVPIPNQEVPKKKLKWILSVPAMRLTIISCGMDGIISHIDPKLLDTKSIKIMPMTISDETNHHQDYYYQDFMISPATKLHSSFAMPPFHMSPSGMF